MKRYVLFLVVTIITVFDATAAVALPKGITYLVIDGGQSIRPLKLHPQTPTAILTENSILNALYPQKDLKLALGDNLLMVQPRRQKLRSETIAFLTSDFEAKLLLQIATKVTDADDVVIAVTRERKEAIDALSYAKRQRFENQVQAFYASKLATLEKENAELDDRVQRSESAHRHQFRARSR